jgi:hypothetical protein
LRNVRRQHSATDLCEQKLSDFRKNNQCLKYFKTFCYFCENKKQEVMNSVVMSDKTGFVLPFLYGKIESLPVELQKEVSLFADFLLSKTSHTAVPKFGSLKGKIHLSADFDAPLDDFKEYM